MTQDVKDAPLIDHLIELRQRLMVAVLVFLGLSCLSYFFVEDIYRFLMQPLADVLPGDNRRLIYTGLTEAFFTYLKLSLFMGAFLSFPIVAVQIWKFVAPGLYENEKKAFLPFLIATPILFIAGAAFVYYAVFPKAWQFFAGFEVMPGSAEASGLGISLEARVSEYLSLVMQLIFAFGLCFQLPVLLTLMARAGIVTAESLAKKRKFAILGAFIIGAVLTPPDIISQVALALPVLLLYELSILAIKFVQNKSESKP